MQAFPVGMAVEKYRHTHTQRLMAWDGWVDAAFNLSLLQAGFERDVLPIPGIPKSCSLPHR